MISIPAYDREGRPTDPVEVEESLLGGAVKYDLLREAVAVYEKRRRIGSVWTRSRGEVAGSGKKLYRQKHTGMARAGTRRAPHRRGSGVAFAIHNRQTWRDLPRKARRAALRSALLSRMLDGELAVVDLPALEAPRTRTVAGYLKKVSPGVASQLLVSDGDDLLYRSGRNIAGVEVCRASDLNALTVMRPHRVLFTRQAFAALLEGLA